MYFLFFHLPLFLLFCCEDMTLDSSELVLSMETAEVLSTVKVEDLKKLASALGISTSI